MPKIPFYYNLHYDITETIGLKAAEYDMFLFPLYSLIIEIYNFLFIKFRRSIIDLDIP
jgi:tRNA G26 N,N-dimethylase Trm1